MRSDSSKVTGDALSSKQPNGANQICKKDAFTSLDSTSTMSVNVDMEKDFKADAKAFLFCLPSKAKLNEK